MSNDQRNPGILLGRPDSIIVVADAIPWPAAVQRQLDHVLGVLGAPRAQLPTTGQHNNDTSQGAET
jgi:hypothetical protein